MIDVKKLFWPERLEGEEFQIYKARRRLAQLTDKSYRQGVMPTLFVQHFNPKKNPNPRGKFVK